MSPPNRNQRVLTGHVTKTLGDDDSYGFIDEDIFFQQCNVEKGKAKVNDRVYAECQYSETLPFNWTATRVKILKPLNLTNSPNNPSSSESFASNNKMSSSLLNNQDNRDALISNNMITTPMLPVTQSQQQFNAHHHNQISGRHDSSDHPQEGPKQLLAPTTNPGEFFNPDIRGGVTPFLGQSSDGYQQFQSHDPLMGSGNKLTYTSQPGSAFMTSPFVPFIPPAALAPQATAGGHHKSMNQDQAGSSRSQNQSGFQNKSNQSRWNDRDTDRSADRKGNGNNSDNRRDKSRMNDNNNRGNRGNSGNGANRGNSGSRDSNNNKNKNSTNINANINNINIKGGNRNKDDRDRRIDGTKRQVRDDASARLSPAPSAAMSTTSNSSSHGKSTRRRYEPLNVPKAPLMPERLNTFDIKQRYPSSLHIPSDLKEVAINLNFRFDLTSIPKPICYKIEVSNKQSEDLTDKQINSQADVSIQSSSVKASNQTPSQEVKMMHKYGVKVILISVPTMEDIYKRLFGQNMDSFSSDRNHPSHLSNTISFLCTKSISGGSSLIGAKFDSSLDGFLPGSSSVQSPRPNLIATCIRCVRDQTGLDLSRCTEWTHLCTFIYNQKNDYFSDSASIEYSYIFMPDVWSLLTTEFQTEFGSMKTVLDTKPEGLVTDKVNEDSSIICDGQTVATAGKDDSTLLKEEAPNQAEDSHVSTDESKIDTSDASLNQLPITSDEKSQFDPDRLAELKVSDLKAELERRNIKFKHGIKKAELIAKLKESIDSEEVKEKSEEEVKPDVDQPEATNLTVKIDETQKETEMKEERTVEEEKAVKEEETAKEETSEKEEGAVEEKTLATTVDEKPDECTESSGVKRKLEESFEQTEKASKKLEIEDPIIDQPVSLVNGELKVTPKGLTTLTTIALHQAAVLPQKHDQFEFSVASNIFKDSLVQHFSEYIFTGLVTDRTGESFTPLDSDEKSFKNPSKLNSDAKQLPSGITSFKDLVDLPIDRYMNIAFTFFDSTHMGYILVDDLSKIFLNSGYSVSKRALQALVGEGEKFNYKSVPDPNWTTAYKFPKQFSEYSSKEESTQKSIAYDSSNNTVEFNGIYYDVEKLIQRSITSERVRVNMFERFNRAITKADQQSDNIRKLEASQRSLSNALNIQNEEICELKREKEKVRQKVSS